MDAWRKAYQQAVHGATINYDPTGSGDGIAAFSDGTGRLRRLGRRARPTTEVGRGRRRSAAAATALDLPMVVGPIAIAYKLSGVSDLIADARRSPRSSSARSPGGTTRRSRR